MDYKCKLVKKTFTTKDGEVRGYYVLEFDILENEKLEVNIKSDKAKLLLLSKQSNNKPENPFWSSQDISSLN